MAEQTTPNGRATIRDVLDAVQGLHDRIDHTNTRIDGVVSAQSQTNRKLTSLETKFDKGLDALREATNDALHKMEDRIRVLEMPWKLLGNGWIKAGSAAGAASAITGLLAKFGWIPFLIVLL